MLTSKRKQNCLHVKKVANTIKFNLNNFRHIRPYLTTDAAKLFMHAMIFSHISYCFTTWSLANITTMKPIESLYKQTLKTLDQKPNRYHHCHIVQKYNLFNFGSFRNFMDCCLVFKVLNGLAPPPLKQFIKRCESGDRTTRATTRGDCEVPSRQSVFGNTVLSVRASNLWNSLPTEVRQSSNYLTFKFNLKRWLKSGQICNHE